MPFVRTKAKPAIVPSLSQAFKSLWHPPEEPAMTSIAGNLAAHILLLSEHPTFEELDKDTQMISDGGRVYANILAEAGFDMERDFLVMPYSRFGSKPNKASTKDTFPLLHEWLPQLNVKCIAVLGMTAFGHTFAGGRKTHAKSIIGKPMYLPEMHSLPVFVLPDSTLMHSIDEKDYRQRRALEDKQKKVFQHCLDLAKFVASLRR